ncbi:unnamed protein product [Alopecurus aequalis]
MSIKLVVSKAIETEQVHARSPRCYLKTTRHENRQRNQMAISLLDSLFAQFPQQWLLLLLLVILLPVISYLLLTRRSAEKGLKLPPGPPRLPVLGNLHQLGPLTHQSLSDLARRHGPVMFLRLGMTTALAVSSAAAARDVMKAHDAHCCNRPELPGNKQLTYGFKTVAFSPYGDYWRSMRRLFATELLGARRVRAAWATRQEQVRKLMAALGEAAARSAPVAMEERVYGVADGIIGTMAFGSVYAAAEFAGRYERFQHVLNEAMDVSAGFAAEDFFPNAAGRLADRLTGVVARRERVVRDLDAFFESVIEHRMDLGPEDDDDTGAGLVDALVGLWKQGEQGFTKDNVKAILLDSFLGGVETSSVTILWAMSELVRKPQVMRKAQEEIRAAVAAVGGGSVQPDDLPKFRYLKMVVKETMRLHPPAPLLLPRETAGNVQIGGYDVPAGTRVLVNVWAIGRDPVSWGEDAEEFVPERFEASEVDFRGAHFELLPFGAGRRMCPGIAMGSANVEFTLANMLYGFDWALPDGVEEVSMEEAGKLTIHPKTPLVLVPTVYRPARGQQ